MSRSIRSLSGIVSAGLIAIAAPVAVFGLAAPAAAQFSSGFKFLDAVKKKDGAAVEQALSLPGATIINTRDVSNGETALHIVTARRDKLWMEYMLAKGANVNARDIHGVSALQLAVSLGFIDGVELLVQYHADADQSNDAGETPLISAVHRRDLPMVRLLIAGGADPVRPDNSGRSATDYAKLDGQEQMIATLAAAAKAKAQRGTAAPSYGPKL